MKSYTALDGGWVTPNNQTQSFAAAATGLSTSTTYYFDEVFRNDSNSSLQYGAVLSFTTLAQ